MAPVSPVFHIVETVRLSLNSKRTNTFSLKIKMSRLESRALKFFSLISLTKQIYSFGT